MKRIVPTEDGLTDDARLLLDVVLLGLKEQIKPIAHWSDASFLAAAKRLMMDGMFIIRTDGKNYWIEMTDPVGGGSLQ